MTDDIDTLEGDLDELGAQLEDADAQTVLASVLALVDRSRAVVADAAAQQDTATLARAARVAAAALRLGAEPFSPSEAVSLALAANIGTCARPPPTSKRR